jgi:hypothetical protein
MADREQGVVCRCRRGLDPCRVTQLFAFRRLRFPLPFLWSHPVVTSSRLQHDCVSPATADGPTQSPWLSSFHSPIGMGAFPVPRLHTGDRWLMWQLSRFARDGAQTEQKRSVSMTRKAPSDRSQLKHESNRVFLTFACSDSSSQQLIIDG